MRRVQGLFLKACYNYDLGSLKRATREIFNANAARPFKFERSQRAIEVQKAATQRVIRLGQQLNYDTMRLDKDVARVRKEAAPNVFR
ncbi:MAG TPA: hypothetical protein VEW42_02625 [Candidatus Eisenbacteria bacterium]|nr:hypothetical protein [Candidatus Eisenbacteria bacterium]